MKKTSAVADLPSEGSILNVVVNVEAVVREKKSASIDDSVVLSLSED
jgi:hypothetical protein